MRKMVMIMAAVAVCAVLAGCAAKTDHSYSPAELYQAENTMIYSRNINKVWDAAIKSIGEKFFVIDNIEKDSKIITLSYSTDSPEDYIDCGKFTITTSGMSNSGTHVFSGAQGNAVYYANTDGTPNPKPVQRTTRLEGKVNIVFSEEGKDKTKVTVNARYILSLKFESQRYVAVGYSGMFLPITDTSTVSFNTGQEGSGRTMRCVTKYSLEKSILEGIHSRL